MSSKSVGEARPTIRAVFQMDMRRLTLSTRAQKSEADAQ